MRAPRPKKMALGNRTPKRLSKEPRTMKGAATKKSHARKRGKKSSKTKERRDTSIKGGFSPRAQRVNSWEEGWNQRQQDKNAGRQRGRG